MSTFSPNWESWYRALKQRDPEIFRKAIEYSEGVTLTFNIALAPAAEYERAMVMLACEILGVEP